MQVFSWKDVLPTAERVIALGYFDGGHVGHRALLHKTAELAHMHSLEAAVFTFPSLPTKGGAPLSTLDDRLGFFQECGISTVILAPFEEIRNFSAEHFILELLVRRSRAKRAVCGFNYRFGFGAEGDSALLCRLLSESTVLPPTLYDGGPVSTSRIREALSLGRVDVAEKMLGRPYSVEGTVSHGKALGGRLGFPTANLCPTTFLPRHGVYKTLFSVDGIGYAGVSDVGVRPTVEGEGEARVETFLPDFSGDLYGRRVQISFLSFLREEKKFASAKELQEQIARDVENCK